MSNQTGFRQGRLGIGKNPIFPLDISGSTRIEGDLILGGTIADINGTPIEFGGATATLNVGTNMPIPEMTITQVPSWEDSVTVEGAGKFLDGANSGDIYYNGGNVGIGTNTPSDAKLEIRNNHSQLKLTDSDDEKYAHFSYSSNFLAIRINSINSQDFIIKEGGNVGIGTTDPKVKLNVEGGGFLVDGTDTVTQQGCHIQWNRSGNHGETHIINNIGGAYNNGEHSGIHFAMTDSGGTVSNKMFIRNNGNVGIGTTSPGQKLEVKTGTNFDGIILNNEDGGLLFKAARSNAKARAYMALYDGTSSAPQGKVVFRNDDYSYITGGNLAIGTTDPGNFKLKIYNSTGTNTNGSNGWHNHFCVEEQTMAGSGVTFKAGTETGYIYYGSSTGSPWVGSGSFGFATTATGNSSDIKMVLKKDGDVGIGTTEPGAKLEINGTSTSHTNNTPTKPSCLIYGEESGEILWIGHPNQTQGIQLGYNTIKKWSTNDGATNDSLYFNISGSRDMTIDSIGNVGIGTTSPYSKFEIKGDDYTGDPTNHVSYLLRLTQEYTQDWASSGQEGGVGMQFFIDNQNQNMWPVGEIYFYCENSDNSETDGSLRFRVSNNNDTSGSASDRANVDAMTIDHTGYIGIGTPTPEYKLDIRDSGHCYLNMYGGATGNTAQIRLSPNNNSSTDPLLYLAAGPVGSEKCVYISSRYNYPMVFLQDNEIKMRIENGGVLQLLNQTGRTNLLMGRVDSSNGYHGRYMYGGYHTDIYYNQSAIEGELSNSNGRNLYLNYYSHYLKSTSVGSRASLGTFEGGALVCSFRGCDYGSTGHMRKNLFIGASYNKDGMSWGWWIGGQNENWSSSDGDLYFGVCRGSTTANHAGYLQDSSGDTRMNFTGQHRTFVKQIPHKETEPYIGLIVSANQNKYIKMGDKKDGGVETGNKAITISEALPMVALTTKEKDKSCFGVICDVEDEDRREFGGHFKSLFHKEKGDTRTFINSLGEGGIWVSDKNGNLESGDYITSSSIPGYGQKQDSEFLANYTVAKITMDCDFNPSQQKVKKIKRHDIKVTYYKSVIPKEDYDEWDNRATPYHEKNEEQNEWVSILNEEDYKQLQDREWDGQWDMPVKSCYTAFEKDELENDMDENNEFMWEDTDEYEYAYNLRYLLEDGTQITKQDYETKKANNEAVYIAAFVGCTYHCG